MSGVVLVRSDRCGLDELFLAYQTREAEHARLELGPGWPRRWTATWRVSGGDVVSAVRDLGAVPVAGCEPVRRFSWRRRQRHRPGLQFMVSTGRLHGFESLEERNLLLALDFAGTVEEVLPQPFLLRFGTSRGEFREHVLDFLVVFRDGSRWLFDVHAVVPGRRQNVHRGHHDRLESQPRDSERARPDRRFPQAHMTVPGAAANLGQQRSLPDKPIGPPIGDHPGSGPVTWPWRPPARRRRIGPVRPGRALRQAACGALLMLPLTVTACGVGGVSCAGQCSPLYQLQVLFKPRTPPATASAELRLCSHADPNVIRVGALQHPDGVNVAYQFTATIYTRHIPKPRSDRLRKCLADQPRVLNAGWPA